MLTGRTVFRLGILVCVSCCAPLSQADSALPPASKISLKGLGPIRIGMTVAEVSKAVNKPLVNLARGASGCSGMSLQGEPADVNFVIADDRVIAVVIGSGRFATISGVRVGDNEARVSSAYAGKTTAQAVGGQRVLRLNTIDPADKEFELSFAMGDDSNVAQIIVARGNALRRCAPPATAAAPAAPPLPAPKQETNSDKAPKASASSKGGDISAVAGETPSEADARVVYERVINEFFPPGKEKVKSFKKTNGLRSTVDGVPLYSLEYAADLIFPAGLRPECVDTEHYNLQCFRVQVNGIHGLPPQPIGARLQDSGKIIFEKAESGWRIRHMDSKLRLSGR